MKKSIGVVALLIAVTAFADVETSGLFQEYMRRETIEFTKSQKTVLNRLQKAGVKPKEIAAFNLDEATMTFTFENNKEELCTGKSVDKSVEYTCASKWNAEDTKLLDAVYKSIPKDQIMDIEIYRESGKFVFQTIDRQMCYGQYIFNTAQFTCFTKAGVLSFFAGGDSD